MGLCYIYLSRCDLCRFVFDKINRKELLNSDSDKDTISELLKNTKLFELTSDQKRESARYAENDSRKRGVGLPKPFDAIR